MTTGFPFLLSFLDKLTDKGIPHTLEHEPGDSLLVRANTTGERWEVQVFEDGRVDVRIFRHDGQVYGVEKLTELV